MPIFSLAKVIDNSQSNDESKVLAVVDHLLPILDDWRKGEDLRNELGALEKELSESQNTLSLAQKEIVELKTNHDATYSKIKSYGKSAPIFFAIGFISAFFSLVGGVFILLVGVVLGFISARKIRKAVMEDIVKLEMEAATSHSKIEFASAERKRLENELSSRAGSFPEVRLAEIRFKVEVAQMAGRNVLLDVSGVHNVTTLKAVDVSDIKQGLSQISDRVNTLLNVPTLLATTHRNGDSDSLHQLYGEEDDLQELVEEYTLNLGKLKDVNLNLPLVSSNSILSNRIASGELFPVEQSTTVLNVSEGKTSDETVAAFVRQVDETRKNGAQVFNELQQVFYDLEHACHQYASARTASINTIHQNLTDALSRASWSNRKFYCPRTILSPQYIQDLLGIDPVKAYLLSLDDLISRLRADEVIAKRFTPNSDLEGQFVGAYSSVQDFLEGLAFDENGNRIDDSRRPKHIEDQFRESVKRFNIVLNRIMTGADYPILNFSNEAQVFYDPDNEEWGGDAVPYVYSTTEILKYGSVIKAYSELMIPLWEHLWTEKADFRKSELFRTNESMIRMSEKESEKLIEIGNQYRADMRTVREHVNLIESELQSKRSEIISFRDGMDMLGLLSDRSKAGITDDKLQDMLIEESALGKTEHFESYLNSLPLAEAENRGTTHDPIDLIREPNALISIQTGSGTRLIPG